MQKTFSPDWTGFLRRVAGVVTSLLPVLLTPLPAGAQPADSLLDFETAYPALRRVYHFQYFSADEGLTSSDCRRVIVDNRGFLWIGSIDGLYRFDGHAFTVYRNNPADSTSISGNAISALRQDSYGTLWAGTLSQGLNAFDFEHNRFIRYQHNPLDSTSLSGPMVAEVYEDRKKRLWIAPHDKLIRQRDTASGRTKVTFEHYLIADSLATVIAYYEDSAGVVWITAPDQKMARFDFETGRTTYLPYDQRIPASLRSKWLSQVYQDRSGLLWIGTNDGLYLFDKSTGSLNHFSARFKGAKELASDRRLRFYEDRTGAVWVASWGGGMNLYNRKTGRFVQFPYPPGDSNGFRGRSIEPNFAEDSAGNLWIPIAVGWSASLAKLSANARQFKHFMYRTTGERYADAVLEDDAGSLWINGRWEYRRGSDQPGRAYDVPPHGQAIYADSAGRIWTGGTFGVGLRCLDPRTGRAVDYLRDPKSNDQFSNRVRSLAFDPSGFLWLGTHEAGVCKFDLRTSRYVGQFSHDPLNPHSISNNAVPALVRDKDGALWAGTEGGGLNRFDPVTREFTRWRHDSRDSGSIPDDYVTDLHLDDRGDLWVGTQSGLCRLDRRTGKFTRYFRGSGELSNWIRVMVSDLKGRMWIAYRADGLSQLDPETGAFRTFSVKDGLPQNDFSQVRAYRRANGEIVMGIRDGILVFHPDSIRDNTYIPPVAITAFKVLDRSLPVQGYIERGEPVVLPHDQNFFSFEVVALDLTDPQRNQHACKLEGLEKQWTHLGSRRDVRYTNVPPGDYVFRVKGSNNQGIWNEQGVALRITVMPPWWRSSWAYAVYVVLAFSALAALRRYEKNRERLKHQLELEQLNVDKMREVDQLKSRFFANISHEFRTPLTLIEGPAVQILAGDTGVDPKQSAGIIVRNARRLLTLVNQLLDMSRLESGRLKLRPVKLDIAELVRGTAAAFESLAARKGIRYETPPGHQPIMGWFDREELEKIVVNLLSNAFKFTPEGGRVTVAVARRVVRHGGVEEDGCSISVTDTGIGIAPDQLTRVFDRFYQVDTSPTREREGAGIGLALAKELTELHGGSISVTSDVGRGSSFTVLLPLGSEPSLPDRTGGDEGEAHAVLIPAEIGEPAEAAAQDTDEDRPLLLIVEDNADMRRYMRTHLEGAFRVVEAGDGEEGVTRAVETVPDLIVSDVMMPKIDGFEVCRRVKTDERTSHIPVILLTAKAGPEHRVEGLETGADDYLVKPFDARELQVRIRNLIEIRRKLRERYGKGILLRPGEVSVTSVDDAFLHKAVAVVEARMEDERFGVDEFSSEMSMSRVQLHRKLKALINQPPGDFIRSMRLQRGMSLLQQNAGTVAEIAYTVGFGSPSYFTKCFHDQFGYPPGEVLRHNSSAQPT